MGKVVQLLVIAHALERAAQADPTDSDQLLRQHAPDESKAPIDTVLALIWAPNLS